MEKENSIDYYEIGCELFENQKFDDALNYFEKSIKHYPNNHDAYFMKGLTLINLMNYPDALIDMEKYIEIYPDNAEAWTKVGWIYFETNKNRMGLNAVETALKLDNEAYDALYMKGIFLLRLKKYSESLQCFERYPENGDLASYSFFGMADALYNLDKKKQSLNAINKSIKIYPEDPEFFNYKGFILMDFEEYKKAIECFEKAIIIDSEFILPYFNIGIVKKELKNFKESLDSFEKVLKINSDYPDAWYQKGIVLQRLNRKKESIESYKKFVELVEKYDIEEDKLYARRIKEYISNEENDGKPIRLDPNNKPSYWQWITRAEYFLDSNGKERESLEPREDFEPGSWWTCHKDTKFGDLILLYRAGKKNGVTYQDLKYLIMATSDAYPISDDEYAFEHGWTYGCDYRPIYKFEKSINLNEMKKDPYLDEWNALNANFNRSVYKTEERHWNYLIQLLKDRNPGFEIEDLKINEIIDEYTTEFELEGALFENISALKKFGFDLDLVGRQVICKGPGGRIDILTKDNKTGEYLVIELKIVRASRDTFGQISEYIGWVIERLSNGNRVKGLVISKGYDNKFKSALNTNPNIQQLELSEVLRELGMKLK